MIASAIASALLVEHKVAAVEIVQLRRRLNLLHEFRGLRLGTPSFVSLDADTVANADRQRITGGSSFAVPRRRVEPIPRLGELREASRCGKNWHQHFCCAPRTTPASRLRIVLCPMV
jgi:hypothetical protein